MVPTSLNLMAVRLYQGLRDQAIDELPSYDSFEPSLDDF
jgi:hypothetical protein